jgi:hypothetical protein
MTSSVYIEQCTIKRLTNTARNLIPTLLLLLLLLLLIIIIIIIIIPILKLLFMKVVKREANHQKPTSKIIGRFQCTTKGSECTEESEAQSREE